MVFGWLSRVKLFWMWRIAFAACLSLTLWGLFAPAPPGPTFEGSDKMMHFLAFGAISVTGRFAFRGGAWLHLWLPLLVFAFSAEFLQSWFQPSRYFSFWDAAANLAGVLIAWAALAILARTKGRYDGA